MPARRRLAAVAAQLGPCQTPAAPASRPAAAATTAPPAAAERLLTAAELAAYREDGYVVVPGVFQDEDFAELQAELGQLVETLAREWAELGLLEDTHAGEGFERRLAALLEELPEGERAERQAEAQL